MAHKTKDGKKSFTNASQARSYDRKTANSGVSASEGAHEMHDQDDPNNDGAPEMTQDAMDSPDGELMAQEHGPAHKIVIQHDEGSNLHHVQTDHPDGHSNMTQHGSADLAHEFARGAAGVDRTK